MIPLFIFLIGCLVMSLVVLGLLFALASVGYGDVYESDSSESSGKAAEPFRRILQPEATHSEPRP